ncbi:MAG: autotransporter-associated beta strand repeat-containing protein [Akkermansiaceae bacterium]
MKPNKNPFRRFPLFALSFSAVFVTQEARAEDRYWDQNEATSGMGGTGDWNTTSSFWRTGVGADADGGTLGTWVNFATDSATNAILSGTSGTLSTTSAIATNKVTVTSGAFIINDGTGGSFSFNGNDRAISVSSGASLRLDRNMSGSGVGLAISGGGTTTFTAANRAYGGGLTVTGAGTKVIFSGSNGLDNNSSSSHSFGSGTTLQLTGQTNYRSTLTLNGATLELNTSQGFVTQNGFNLSVSGSKSSVTSLLANTGTANAGYGAIGGNGGTAGKVTVASTSHVSGVDLEYSAGFRNGTLGKAGAGVMRLNTGFIMNQDNNYTTFDNAGTALNITAGTFLNEGLVKSITNVNGSTSVLKTGSSSGTFDQVNVTNGVFEVSRSSDLFTTGLTYASGNNALNLRGGTLKYVGITTDYSSQIGDLIGSSLVDTNGQDVTFASDLTGTGTISKTGSGVLTLAGNNSFGSGTLTFGSGTQNRGYIRLESNTALGSHSSVTLAGNQGGTSGLQLEGGVTFSQSITTQGRQSATSSGYIIRSISGNNAWNGDVTITAAGGGYGFVSDSGTLTLGGTITSNVASTQGSRLVTFAGPGNINVTGNLINGGNDFSAKNLAVTKDGSGTLTLAGTNDYSGNTSFNNGTTLLTGSISQSANVTIGAAATLDVSSHASPGYAFTSTQTLSGNGTLTGNASTTGTVSPGALYGTLTSAGNFTFNSGSTLRSDVNISGVAQVETATAAGSATAAGDVNVTVTSAALGAPVIIAVPILMDDSAEVWAPKVRTALSADASLSALFSVGGSSTNIVLTRLSNIANDATLNIALANGTTSPAITAAATSANTTSGSAPGTDLLAVTGQLAVAGATLDLIVTGTPTAPAYVIATYGSLAPGNFAAVNNLPPGYQVNYTYNSGTAIALVPTAVSNNFASWASANGVTGGPTGDSDNDGILNLVEYALALNFNGSDGSAGTFTGNLLTFTKRQDAIDNADVSWVIETSQTLAPDSWTPAVTQNPGNTDPTISFTLPTGQGKIFGRLKVLEN